MVFLIIFYFQPGKRIQFDEHSFSIGFKPPLGIIVFQISKANGQKFDSTYDRCLAETEILGQGAFLVTPKKTRKFTLQNQWFWKMGASPILVSRWWLRRFLLFPSRKFGGNDPVRRVYFSNGWQKSHQLVSFLSFTPLKINGRNIIMEVWSRSCSFQNGWWL